MDRRKFIESLAALGFVGAIEGTVPASALAAPAARKNRKGLKKFDENLVVLISDLHSKPGSYQPEKTRRVVEEILKMRPLPVNVITFGDLAYHTGRPEEYALAKELLAPLEEAGIKLTHAMGNHDRRANFAAAFPEKAAQTLLPGRMVFKVETPRADFIMLDSLQEGDNPNTWITPGALDAPQVELLRKMLAESDKPVFVGSHHPLSELRIKDLLCENLSCCGFIHGHDHIWRPGWVHKDYKNAYILRTLCLPSTGHWGDIGYTAFRLYEDKAVAELHELEFFFPADAPVESEVQSAMIAEDNKGAKCSFTLKRTL